MVKNICFMQSFFALVYMGALLFPAPPAAEGGWMLAEDGVSRSVVIISGEASAVERHAADELAHFLGKVTAPKLGYRKHPCPVNSRYGWGP